MPLKVLLKQNGPPARVVPAGVVTGPQVWDPLWSPRAMNMYSALTLQLWANAHSSPRGRNEPVAASSAPKAPPVLPLDQLWALVDTGAMESCIDADLAMRLNLPIIDRRQISGVHGAREVNVHLAHIHISSLNFTIYGPFCAVDLAAGGQYHRALIGRTFLQNFTMMYDGRTGDVILSND